MTEISNHLISAGALRLNVYEWGVPGKPPLILLHGLASSSHMFSLLAPRLAANYHVIAYDQRGHGLSDKPDSGYSFETIASDLDHLLNALGLRDEPVMLVGHSWGAATVLYDAVTHPLRVRKGILVDGGLRPVTDVFARLEAMAPPQYTGRSIADVKQMIKEKWLGEHWRPELEPLVMTIYDVSDPADVQPHLTLANHMQIAQALWNFRPQDYLPQVRCPLLLIQAVNSDDQPDARIQSYVAQAQSQNPLIKFIQMPDTIHDIPWQKPDELAEIILRFLDDSPVSKA